MRIFINNESMHEYNIDYEDHKDPINLDSDEEDEKGKNFCFVIIKALNVVFQYIFLKGR